MTAIDFSKRPKFEKSTHPECFPVDKNKFLTKVKPLALENYKTQEKTGYWGFLLNPCIKYEGPLLDELRKLCKLST